MKFITTLILAIIIALPTAQAKFVMPKTSNNEIKIALKKVPKEQREGLRFLVENMTQGDLDTLKADFLLTEVAWAYKARETFAWCRELPDSIFYNDVLPYASMDETREPWRQLFWEKCYPLVKDLTDVRQAIDTLNKYAKEVADVEYNTKRRRPNQSPRESMEIKMASCSGLSIILTDIFRTMGIPSRIAGTPLWVSREGNHNWSEVWIDGKWYFTEYYPNAALNKSWFLERAGKADKADPIYWMYATSWKKNSDGQHFPMVWARGSKEVPGVVVTDFYIDLYNAEQAQNSAGVPLSIKLYATAAGAKSSGDRVAADVKILDAEGKIVAVGTTKGPLADMNDYLTLYLAPGAYKVVCVGAELDVVVASEAVVVELFED